MITYNTQGTELPEINQPKVNEWLEQVAVKYSRKIGEINYVFVDDETILSMNREFIGHDYYTDHIGFDYCQGSFLSGDIYISLDTVRTNAEKFSASYEQELHRVIVHGLLHLCGIEDKSPEQRLVMERAENEALAICVY